MRLFLLLVALLAILPRAFPEDSTDPFATYATRAKAKLLADGLPDPAALPEKIQAGDMPAVHPREAAARLRAGKALLDQGAAAKALEEFNKAAELDEYQFLACFYQAVAAYRIGDYSAALRSAKRGLELIDAEAENHGANAPEIVTQRKRFQELETAIEAKAKAKAAPSTPAATGKKDDYESALKEGDDAFAKGLIAKAAAAYARAYRADPRQGEIGLRAASLYADRLKNLLEAARLWQQVVAGGEPHATTARAELQSHREALDGLLQTELAKLHSWIADTVSYANGKLMGRNPAEPLQLAEAFPESMELQVELALLYIGNDDVAAAVTHLETAARLGFGPDEFLARKEFTNPFGLRKPSRQHPLPAGSPPDDDEDRITLLSPKGAPLAQFVRDAYGEETLNKIRAELKRRADEAARAASERAEKARQAKLAQEQKELSAWRDGERSRVVAEANSLITALNNVEVAIVAVQPVKKVRYRNSVTPFNELSLQGSTYTFRLWDRSTSVFLSTGSVAPTVREQVITVPSFAGMRSVTVEPVSYWWHHDPQYSTPADPSYRTLVRTVVLNFNRSFRVRETIDLEFEPADDSAKHYDNESETWSISFLALLRSDADIARLKQLFTRLAELDAAGSDLKKLRALRE